MDEEFRREFLERLKGIEQPLDTLGADHSQPYTYARSRAHLIGLRLRPPM
jgi:hypothetical protein